GRNSFGANFFQASELFPAAEFLLAPIYLSTIVAAQEARVSRAGIIPLSNYSGADESTNPVVYFALDNVAWQPSGENVRRAPLARPREQHDDSPLFATAAILAALGTPWDAFQQPRRRAIIVRPLWQTDDAPAMLTAV